jgi:hypothetical protein
VISGLSVGSVGASADCVATSSAACAVNLHHKHIREKGRVDRSDLGIDLRERGAVVIRCRRPRTDRQGDAGEVAARDVELQHTGNDQQSLCRTRWLAPGPKFGVLLKTATACSSTDRHATFAITAFRSSASLSASTSKGVSVRETTRRATPRHRSGSSARGRACCLH